eukprot:6213450-Pleurochrysis_carterae.AAC.2
MGSKPGSRVDDKSPCDGGSREEWNYVDLLSRARKCLSRVNIVLTKCLFVNLMLDIDYLGEVNNPDGLPGLYNQELRMYRRVTPASRPTGNVVGNCEIQQYLLFAVRDAVISETVLACRESSKYDFHNKCFLEWKGRFDWLQLVLGRDGDIYKTLGLCCMLSVTVTSALL